MSCASNFPFPFLHLSVWVFDAPNAEPPCTVSPPPISPFFCPRRTTQLDCFLLGLFWVRYSQVQLVYLFLFAHKRFIGKDVMPSRRLCENVSIRHRIIESTSHFCRRCGGAPSNQSPTVKVFASGRVGHEPQRTRWHFWGAENVAVSVHAVENCFVPEPSPVRVKHELHWYGHKLGK